MIVIVIAVLVVAGLISLVAATQWRDTPKPKVSLQLAKPQQQTLLAEEVVTVTRRRTVKATRT